MIGNELYESKLDLDINDIFNEFFEDIKNNFDINLLEYEKYEYLDRNVISYKYEFKELILIVNSYQSKILYHNNGKPFKNYLEDLKSLYFLDKTDFEKINKDIKKIHEYKSSEQHISNIISNKLIIDVFNFFDKLYSEKKDEQQNELKELKVDRIRNLISKNKK